MIGAGSNRPRMAVFDVCQTLYAANTSLGFVRQHHARCGPSLGAGMVAAIDDRRSPLFYLSAALHHGPGLDVHRWTLARSLWGASRAALAESAAAYVREVLPGQVNAPVLARLEAHRAAGDRIVLISNSFDIAVAAIAQALGVEWHASRLGFTGDLCTGRIEADLTGRKSELLVALLAQAVPDPVIHVYTDNQSDRDLVAMADHPTIVIPRGKSRASWAGIDADFIEL